MVNSSQEKYLLPIFTVLAVFVGLFLYGKFGPPFPIYQTSYMKADTFSVSGTGKAYAKPDIAQVNFGVTVSGNNITQIQSQANEKLKRITDEIKKLGIEEKDIKTTNYDINPNYTYVNGSNKIDGYSVSSTLQVKIRDFEKAGKVIDGATAQGANQVGGLSFLVDDLEVYKAQARKEAIEKAKTQAQNLAKATGIRLGRITGVWENPSDTPSYEPRMMNAQMGEKMADTSIQAGQQEIVITINLNYETR